MSTASDGYDARSGTMDFSLALTELKRGEHVRRQAWPYEAHLLMLGGKVILAVSGRELMEWHAHSADLMALDWETVYA